MTDKVADKQKLELIRLKNEYTKRLSECYDANAPSSRPTKKQNSILKDGKNRIFWVVGGNRSGKTQLGARIVSWWMQDAHPHIKRPKEWGQGPLQMLLVAKTNEMAESEIWEKKIKPFLSSKDYKEVRVGNSLARVVNPHNGNRIIFQSHVHGSDDVREKAQGFTAQIVWLDEMPRDARLVTELVTRTLSNDGFLYCTFTPLVRNDAIRRMVEAAKRGDVPKARVETLLLLDNPLYNGREEEMTQQIRTMCVSEEEFRARMYGEWYYGSDRVFAYSAEHNHCPLPPTYDRGWRHVAVVDPSASGLTGLSLWAESPDNHHWYCVKAKYLKGEAAYILVNNVEKEIAGYNVWERIADCNPAGFYKEAHRRGIRYVPMADKKDRKLAMIDTMNELMLSRKVWITPAAEVLEEELNSCSWDEDGVKIVKESKYHTADTMRYFCDRIPAPLARPQNLSYTQQIRMDWKDRQAKVAKEIEKKRMKIVQKRNRWRKRGTRSRAAARF